MRYFLDKCEPQSDGALLIPAAYVAALRKQIATPYAALSDVEQGYDRDEADKMIAIMRGVDTPQAEVFSRAECIFNYCDSPSECKDTCRHAHE